MIQRLVVALLYLGVTIWVGVGIFVLQHFIVKYW